MNKEKIAWDNAIEVETKDPKQIKMCYLCNKYMYHATKWNSDLNQRNGWNIDHIDGNHNNNNVNNLCAVHYSCNVKKGDRNYSDFYKKQKSGTWIPKNN